VDRDRENHDSIRGRKSAASVNLAIAGIRAAFAQAARAANLSAVELAAVDTVTKIKRITPPAPEIRVVTPADRVRLFAALPLRVRLVAETLYVTGARVSEIVTARREFVRQEGDAVSITLYGKGSKERRARIPASLHAAIVSEFGETGEFIFTTEQGNPFRRQYITREIARAARRVLGARITAHDLRHSRGTDLYKQTGRLVAVKNLLAHAGIETTARFYVRDDFTTDELFTSI
jgi:integrase